MVLAPWWAQGTHKTPPGPVPAVPTPRVSAWGSQTRSQHQAPPICEGPVTVTPSAYNSWEDTEKSTRPEDSPQPGGPALLRVPCPRHRSGAGAGPPRALRPSPGLLPQLRDEGLSTLEPPPPRRHHLLLLPMSNWEGRPHPKEATASAYCRGRPNPQSLVTRLCLSQAASPTASPSRKGPGLESPKLPNSLRPVRGWAGSRC